MNRRVLVFGTFDLLHQGHRYFLSQARHFGETLIAVVARDDFVRQRKEHAPVDPMEKRMQILEETGLADEVYPADKEIGSYHILKKTSPDVICLGYDQRELKTNLEEWLEVHHKPLEIHVLPPFNEHIYKTTLLRAQQNE
ncbi:adenylyltransferase/cytidyltransferase family protein [Marispirochaeta sp.]|uniref:adenylyltransferase/cytidyltransferase family protein n=1 Tax=Marispirochaeta sp. TaxID=2038653 RepID=UPI0029C95969|nr:adenylyltransferase/cytidyltransferase family protein [Marispirochaeta sp.]